MRRILIAVFVLTAIGTIFGLKVSASNPQQIASSALPQFTPKLLSEFDGTNPNKPIYLALDGFVYDVTAGKAFYQTGGAYHYLAGRDSSKPLHIAGGAIIKRKYKIIGVLKQ